MEIWVLVLCILKQLSKDMKFQVTNLSFNHVWKGIEKSTNADFGDMLLNNIVCVNVDCIGGWGWLKYSAGLHSKRTFF